VFYDASRKLILKGVDGVVFVADSQEARFEANLESLDNLKENLREQGSDLERIPCVMQYNKRDLGSVMPVEDLRRALNPDGRMSDFEASAATGKGVFETLKALAKLVLLDLRRGSK
jgi:signal recognition particle receptor subunit beta